ncbi:hypothetical protein pb186bvf_020846 [Paramecium bursaria]
MQQFQYKNLMNEKQQQKTILFQLKEPVTQAGDQISGFCYVRCPDDIAEARLSLSLQYKQFSKVLHKQKVMIDIIQIPYDKLNPQMIPDQYIDKLKQVQISQESIIVKDQKKYELVGNQLFRIIRQYGLQEPYIHQQEIYNGSVRKGDYKFPFSIQTQGDMPSSFSYRSEDGFKQAKVGYKLVMLIEIDGQSYMKKSTEVYINGRQDQQAIKKQVEGNIIQFVCLNRGTVEMDVCLQKNIFIPGESIQILYSIDNTRCSRDINRIEVRLLNKLTFIDESEEERIVENRTLLKLSFAGINSGTKNENITRQVDLPKDMQASLKTQFIKNQYYLQIEALADAFMIFMSVPAIIQIPIQIKESRLQSPISLDGWSFVPILQQSANVFSNMTVQQSYMP